MLITWLAIGGTLGVVFIVVCALFVYLIVNRQPSSKGSVHDYEAIGNFRPTSSVLSWGSQTSLAKISTEESHQVQPKVKSQEVRRCRTLSEASNSSGSIDCQSVNSASLGLQADLYTKKDCVLRQQSSTSRQGALHMRVSYDFGTCDLIVHLIEILDAGSEGTLTFPFVTLQLEPAVDTRMRQTSVSHSALYNEYFKFPVSFDKVTQHILYLQVCDFDRFSQRRCVGEVRVDLSSTDISASVELFCDIEPPSQVVTDSASLLLSLNYLPTAERLTLSVIKGRGLPNLKTTRTEWQVRVSLNVRGKCWRKKKTRVVREPNDPAWNEAMTFSLTSSLLEEAQLHVTCVGGSEQQEVGVVKLEAGTDHWQQMLSNPRKAVTRWHTLESS